VPQGRVVGFVIEGAGEAAGPRLCAHGPPAKQPRGGGAAAAGRYPTTPAALPPLPLRLIPPPPRRARAEPSAGGGDAGPIIARPGVAAGPVRGPREGLWGREGW
jgi:hypothetical protein